MNELIICVQVNEGMPRHPNANIPFTPHEIAEVALESRKAGAALIHMHARTADGGMDDTVEGYREVFRAIRERSDILMAPPLLNRPGATDDERLAAVFGAEDAAEPDFLVVETGSTNFDLADAEEQEFLSDERMFLTTTRSQVRFLSEAERLALPVLAVTFGGAWSRAIGIHARAGRLPDDGLVLLVHGGPEFPAAIAADTRGFRAHRDMLPPDARFEWMVSAHRANILDIAEEAITLGGHIAIGVGDFAHSRAGGHPSSAELVAEVAELGRKHGRPPATPDQVRSRFARTPTTRQVRHDRDL